MKRAMEGGALSRVLHCNLPRQGVRYGVQCVLEGGALSHVLHYNVSREGVRYGMQCAMEGGALSCVLHCNVPREGVRVEFAVRHGEGGPLSRVLHCNVSREGVRYGMQCAIEGGALSCVLHLSREPRKRRPNALQVPPPRRLSWPCVSDLRTMYKAESCNELQPSITRPHNEGCVK
jgi:hypothetical protein